MTTFINDPPDNAYGVIVVNDKDAKSLLWLVGQIGENRLIASVEKYKKRYPNSRPFVSTVLKWYRLKVPVRVYSERRS